MQFLQKIQNAFELYPNHQAFCINNIWYTYNSLAGKIVTIQQNINKFHLHEERLGVIVSDDLETYATVLAILFLGKTYIPIHPDHPAERIAQIIGEAHLKTIYGYTNVVLPSNTTIVATSVIEPVAGATIHISKSSDAEKNAYILFTSGSTGIPKGVPVSYQNVDAFVNAFFSLGYEIDDKDRFLQMFDLTFDLSVMSYLIPLCIGACIYTIPAKGIKYMNVYHVLSAHNITFALMVPSIMASLKPYFSEIELPLLRYSLFCGEALYKDLVAEWYKCAPNSKIDNVYGPTEATIFCTTYAINKEEEIAAFHGIVAIGKPMANMHAIIFNENFEPVARGEKGELCLHGYQVTNGYLHDRHSKNAFFTHNHKRYYRTGDIAFVNDKDELFYCGRLDHQVKIQGYRVELSEIEHHLKQITENSHVVAIVIDDPNSGLNEIAVILEGEEKDTTKLLDALKTKIPQYMMPSQIHFLTELPKNANHKTDRNALKQMLLMEQYQRKLN